ncbi:MAG: F0F1 ATP synthase subunit A [Candidatus Moranbacteria bacterium]|nr:F0F1 ATP synthase subunit A [Candidatus Moranbacteria bacterium]
MHVSLSAQEVINIGGFSITNTLITTWVVMTLIVLISYLGTKNMHSVPKGLQNLLELSIEKLFNFFNSVWENREQTKKYFSLLATFFIFIIVANWLGLLIEAIPGIKYIGFFKNQNGHEAFVPLFRSVNSDLNATLSWAIISVFLVQVFGITSLGVIKYGSKFFNFQSPIYFFVGILEFISEFAKVVSFSFRLFGNIFAGEVLLVVVAAIAPLIAPIPFYGLEIFVGFVQALVFTMLTLVFIKMAVTVAHH